MVSGEKGIELHIHGGIGDQDRRESYLKRQSWEGFANVGFRTAIELRGENCPPRQVCLCVTVRFSFFCDSGIMIPP